MRKFEEQKSWAEETIAIDQLTPKLQSGKSPWRTLQKVVKYWEIYPMINAPTLNTKVKKIAIQRLHEVAKGAFEESGVILLELGHLLDMTVKNRPTDIQNRISGLLENIEQHPGFQFWQAPLMSAKAKHFIAVNDFKSAVVCFREALAACSERSYGSLRGFIAKDLFATVLQTQKLNVNNHEKYLREMLANGVWGNVNRFNHPKLEDVAPLVDEYFWQELYKPYKGIKNLKP